MIARIDADDWIHRDRLALQRALLDARPDLAAVGSAVRIFPRRDLRDGRRAYESGLDAMDGPEILRRNRFIECPVAHPTLTIRRSALAAHPYRDSWGSGSTARK